MRIRQLLYTLPALLIAGAQIPGNDLSATLEQAQSWIREQQFKQAIDVLERALPQADDAGDLLALLRHAYRAEIQNLTAEGRRSEARKYLERLQLIENAGTQRHRTLSEMTPPVSRPGQTAPVTTPKTVESDSRSARPSRNQSSQAAGTASSQENKARRIRNTVKLLRIVPIEPASDPPAATTEQPSVWLWQADVLFQARKYRDAGQLYARVHRADPAALRDATDRWAYCRMVQLAEQINRQPKSSEAWTAIEQEAQSILSLIPDNEYAQKLVKLAKREDTDLGPKGGAGPRVVRANTPDDPDESRHGLLRGLASRIGLGQGADWPGRSLWKRFQRGPWQVLETSNFRIHYTDQQIAGPAADVAERARLELYRTWFGAEPQSDWRPKCDIFIYRSPAAYARATGQGGASPGHSTTLPQAGRVLSRRIDLRQDAPDLIRAVLPHEITHVVMADRFTDRHLPRWADEGIAVLSEPAEKKQAHLKNLSGFLQRGQRFSATQLMSMGDYPPGQLWPLFYGQSVSLVEFLVERGGPARFIDFLSRSLRNGYEGQLEEFYGFKDFSQLDQAWAQARTGQVASSQALNNRAARQQ